MGIYVAFVESKALRGRSKHEYLRQVRKLGEHYPGRGARRGHRAGSLRLSGARREVEKLRPSTLNQAVVALGCLTAITWARRWALWERFEIRRDHPLPIVLTRGEAGVISGADDPNLVFYACLIRDFGATVIPPGDAKENPNETAQPKGPGYREGNN